MSRQTQFQKRGVSQIPALKKPLLNPYRIFRAEPNLIIMGFYVFLYKTRSFLLFCARLPTKLLRVKFQLVTRKGFEPLNVSLRGI